MKPGEMLSRARVVAGIVHGRRAFGGPYQAGIYLTNRCNLRCIHCYYYSPFLEMPAMRQLRRARQKGSGLPDKGYLKDLQTREADTGRTRKLIREMLSTGTRRFQFSGYGEVFMHKDALELMALAKGGGAYCLANTNGTLLDRDKIDELIRMGFDELRVTVLAGTAEIYERTHPGVKPHVFDRLRENLSYMSERKAVLKLDRPRLLLVCIVIAQNHDGLFDFAKMAAEIRADKVLYKPVDDIEDPGLAGLVPSPEQAAEVRRQIEEARRFLDAAGINHNIANFSRVFQRQLDTSALYRVIPCYFGWLSVSIETDGTVYPCCRCYEPMGNVYEGGFSAVWKGAAYNDFRKKTIRLNTGERSPEGCDCGSCPNHEANLRVYRMLNPLRRRFLGNIPLE